MRERLGYTVERIRHNLKPPTFLYQLKEILETFKDQPRLLISDLVMPAIVGSSVAIDISAVSKLSNIDITSVSLESVGLISLSIPAILAVAPASRILRRLLRV